MFGEKKKAHKGQQHLLKTPSIASASLPASIHWQRTSSAFLTLTAKQRTDDNNCLEPLSLNSISVLVYRVLRSLEKPATRRRWVFFCFLFALPAADMTEQNPKGKTVK